MADLGCAGCQLKMQWQLRIQSINLRDFFVMDRGHALLISQVTNLRTALLALYGVCGASSALGVP